MRWRSPLGSDCEVGVVRLLEQEAWLRVVVVGAGIVGAAVAYESARAGAEVVLFDKSLPASGVTGDSFTWIGGPRGGDVPDDSTPLRPLCPKPSPS